MAGTMSINVREMTPDDYDKVYELWMSIQGFGPCPSMIPGKACSAS